jgi:hypothetical protein
MPNLLLRRRNQPTLDLNFLANLPSQLSFTRASNAWYFNASSTLTLAGTNGLRFENDLITGAARGLRLEEQRTNSVRTANASGATVGTLGSGGALPTNWLYNAVSGVTASVAATGTQNGMSYVDVRFQAASAGATSLNLAFETNTGIAAASGQSWTTSFYVRRSAGANTSITSFQVMTAGMNGTAVDQESSVTAFTPSTSFLRPYNLRTLNNAATTNLSPRLVLNFNSGAAFDITLRLALPQAEQGTFPTSPIVTTGTTLTRAADVLAPLSLGSWYQPGAGTLFCECQHDGIPPAAGFPRMVSLNDNTANNEISLYLNSGTSALAGIVKNATVNQAETSGTTPITGFSEGLLIKQAMRFGTNDVAVSNNGSAVQTDNTVTLPTVTQLQCFRIGSGSIYSGWLRRVRYWNYGLDNALLSQVTT